MYFYCIVLYIRIFFFLAYTRTGAEIEYKGNQTGRINRTVPTNEAHHRYHYESGNQLTSSLNPLKSDL